MDIGNIDKFILHFVGNKNNGDGVRLSDIMTDFGSIEKYVKDLFKKSFKSEELYQFYFQPTIELNPMYQFVTNMFEENESFIKQSRNAGRYLYDKSQHPQIKGGELCVVLFKNCQINDARVDCIGLFKIENKDTILKVSPTKRGFILREENGINTSKLDKGCLIFNTNKDDGYLISVVDNTNKKAEAQYWKKEFLGVQPVKNEFHLTNEFLDRTKRYVTEQLVKDIDSTEVDQIDLLNRSVEYFKGNKNFELEEFGRAVFQDEELIGSFNKFNDSCRGQDEIELPETFEISNQAVKKQLRAFKKTLKLDDNFDIHIHGDRGLIEQGIDGDGRKFYKLYYQDER